jgi:ATP-dependent Clp protease ATP-binding subunit ClpA
MHRLIQDMIRRALADELLFGRLLTGGKVVVDLDETDKVQLSFDGPVVRPVPPAGEGEERSGVETVPA